MGYAHVIEGGVDRRTVFIFSGLVLLAFVIFTVYIAIDDGLGRGKWTSDPDLPKPGRDGTPPPRDPTPTEQAETGRKVQGPKPLPKDTKPVGKDGSW